HLERATPLGGRMGGHVVLGHVDAIGRLVDSTSLGEARRVTISMPAALAPFVAAKGSIAVDGVSLTVNEVRDGADVEIGIVVVPHTLGSTRLAGLPRGTEVNLEVD